MAEEVGAAIAERRRGVVCGGLGGVMEAACRGARSRGGLTSGSCPGATARTRTAGSCVALPTGLGEARNALIVRAADAVVAIGGGWGTLTEIALALKTGGRWSAWARGSWRAAASRSAGDAWPVDDAADGGRRGAAARAALVRRIARRESSRSAADPSRGAA